MMSQSNSSTPESRDSKVLEKKGTTQDVAAMEGMLQRSLMTLLYMLTWPPLILDRPISVPATLPDHITSSERMALMASLSEHAMEVQAPDGIEKLLDCHS
jgi:hypothetical protein